MRKTLLCASFAFLLILGTSAEAVDEQLQSTILEALRGSGGAIGQLDPVVLAILADLTPEQVDSLLSGEDFSEIYLSTGETLEQRLGVLSFNIGLSTFDGGGSRSLEGPITVQGTAGQPDAGDAGQGNILLRSGYWPELAESLIFTDGFETGDTSRWSATVP